MMSDKEIKRDDAERRERARSAVPREIAVAFIIIRGTMIIPSAGF